jgi:hypothetical protein
VRPTPAESLRAIQAAVAEQLTPELSSLFAIEASTAITMLCESLIAEEDTLAEDLLADNTRLRDILASARHALRSNTNATSLVSHIDGVLHEAGDRRLAISSLSEDNDRLNAVLAQLLELIEDREDETLAPVRRAAYRHLRRVTCRGWSYFDVSGFRQRIIEARAEIDRDG